MQECFGNWFIEHVAKQLAQSTLQPEIERLIFKRGAASDLPRDSPGQWTAPLVLRDALNGMSGWFLMRGWHLTSPIGGFFGHRMT
ncbi:hypothetical protein ACMAUO_18420 [Gluconacetobacter sp. Hr-1-5]|uniref:hypothetical protein n=1 Tax=Gluconacetobacter sp. Hr-1-5 TaxID=3395370 RepID=UPI003B528E07